MPFIDLNISNSNVVADNTTVTFTGLCLSTITPGDVVYISGSKAGGLIQVDKVDITTTLKMPAVGIVIEKLTSTTAIILCSGEVKGVYSCLDPGKTYFVNQNARLDKSLSPYPRSGIQYIQAIAYSLSFDSLFVRIHLPTIQVAE